MKIENLANFSARLATIFFASAFSHLAIGQEDFKFCRQAEFALSQEKLDEAVSLYNNCLRDGNLSAQTISIVNRNLGLINFNKREYTQSIPFFDEAIRLNNNDPWDDLVSRGNSWAASGNLSRALEDYEAALKLQPGFATANFNRGIAYEKFGKTEEAKVDFLTAREKGLYSPQTSLKLSMYGLAIRKNSTVDLKREFRSEDEFIKFVFNFSDIEHNRNICGKDGLSATDFAHGIMTGPDYRKFRRSNRATTARNIYTSSPCPFSPSRPELVPVRSRDLEGVWLSPKSSQRYRFGSKSMAWQTDARALIHCEVIGFFPKGEMRSLALSGPSSNCDFTSAKALDPARNFPKAVSWSLLENGRLNVTRTDIKNYVEEWDIFIAVSDFFAAGLQVKKGDLVSYLRKELGND